MSDEAADDFDLESLNDDELAEQVHDDLYNGLKSEVEEATRIFLRRGWSAERVLNDALVEGMRIVGIDFRDGILFVPEVLLAANAMKAGMEILRPLLAESGVEPTLLMAMVISAGAGAWIGAGIVSRMRRRVIQVSMGVALLLAAGFFTMTNLGVIPPTGSAMGLAGWRFALAVVANFVLGALMCVGIGNYAPSMALLAFLGMHPIAAFPIMFASDGVLIPVASLGFLRSGRFAPAVAVGLTLGGIVGTIAAFPLVKTLGQHLTLMRWVVTVVIGYAAIAMLRSARTSHLAPDA